MRNVVIVVILITSLLNISSLGSLSKSNLEKAKALANSAKKINLTKTLNYAEGGIILIFFTLTELAFFAQRSRNGWLSYNKIISSKHINH